MKHRIVAALFLSFAAPLPPAIAVDGPQPRHRAGQFVTERKDTRFNEASMLDGRTFGPRRRRRRPGRCGAGGEASNPSPTISIPSVQLRQQLRVKLAFCAQHPAGHSFAHEDWNLITRTIVQ
jgi:hypothetical protein